MGESSQETLLDVDRLRDEISKIYAEVAATPDGEYHFHTGIPLAEKLGYPSQLLQRFPSRCVESFAGVGNPFSLGEINPGEVVLDIGSGCGFDTFIASEKVGEEGKAIGIDMTEQMLEKAKGNAKLLGYINIEFRRGHAEDIPAETCTMDVVISNGVINLCLDKGKVFSEAYRILKPGGRLMISDIIVHKEVPEEAKREIDLWTGWIGGALLEAEYLRVIEGAGFEGVELVSRVDVFEGANGEEKARAFGTEAVNIRAKKPK